MISRLFWDEIKENWPDIYWDEYLRLPDIKKSRQCIYPEISRVRNFGRDLAASGKQFYSQYIESIIYNTKDVYYDLVDLNTVSNSQFHQNFYRKFNES
ncbi:hypothetical protein MXB_2457, partial [Myxobolus squamalis]